MKKFSNLMATEWIDMLSTETLVKLFELSTSGDGTKEGGFVTASLVINELSIRGKMNFLNICKIENTELIRKILAEMNSAERSANGKLSTKQMADAMEYHGAPAALAKALEEAEKEKAKREKMADESLEKWTGSMFRKMVGRDLPKKDGPSAIGDIDPLPPII